jgi:hypothetical protein
MSNGDGWDVGAEPSPKELYYKPADLGVKPGAKLSVYVSHVEDGRDFYFQLNSQLDVIEEIGAKVEAAAKVS